MSKTKRALSVGLAVAGLFLVYSASRFITARKIFAGSGAYTIVQESRRLRDVNEKVWMTTTIAFRADGSKAKIETRDTPKGPITIRELIFADGKNVKMVEPLYIGYSRYFLTNQQATKALRQNPMPATCLSSKEERILGERALDGQNVIDITRTVTKESGGTITFYDSRNPSLKCEVQESLVQELDADGRSEKNVKMTTKSLVIGEPDPQLFLVPPYTSVPPSEIERRGMRFLGGETAIPASILNRWDDDWRKGQPPPDK